MKVLSHGSEHHGPLDLIAFLPSKRHLVRSQLHDYGTSFKRFLESCVKALVLDSLLVDSLAYRWQQAIDDNEK